ncbi:type II secretion system minor pseudopilin GspJ [Sphingobium sp. H39-3-25]|uniref:type II secretion system minor pseudopilin GspJ n=1 Tax=Sphingobium arseniciresistens TaxID=3030834 RepID=UPI0023B88B78|nr:type II secretion system minor pseudopilin GspJ [Sphingobium arseniciresistens]
MQRQARERGFTLIELLVALTIFAMLAAAGVMLLGNSVSAQAGVKVRLDELTAIERANGIIASDLGQAMPRISRTEAGTLAPAFFAQPRGEGAPIMQFVRGGWSNLSDAPRPTVQKVEYWLRAGKLERRSYPMVDGAAGSDPAVMVENVESATLRFRDAQGQWLDLWTPTQPDLLPRAVEIKLVRMGDAPLVLRYLVAPGPPEKKGQAGA